MRDLTTAAAHVPARASVCSRTLARAATVAPRGRSLGGGRLRLSLPHLTCAGADPSASRRLCPVLPGAHGCVCRISSCVDLSSGTCRGLTAAKLRGCASRRRRPGAAATATTCRASTPRCARSTGRTSRVSNLRGASTRQRRGRGRARSSTSRRVAPQRRASAHRSAAGGRESISVTLDVSIGHYLRRLQQRQSAPRA